MTTSVQVQSPRTFGQFAFWIVISIVFPILPFGLTWVIAYLGPRSFTASNIVAKPDLAFVAFIAVGTTLIDLINTVREFQRYARFVLAFGGLLIALAWSIGVYAVLINLEFQGLLPATFRILPFLAIHTGGSVGFAFACQVFLFSYRVRPA